MPTNSSTVTVAPEDSRRSDSDPRTATATHALALVLEAMVDRLVSERLDATLAARAPAAVSARPGRWMTTPAASRETGVPVRTIRAWAHEGRVQKRVTNRSADPKQEKFKVNADEVAAVAEQRRGAPAIDSTDLEERARRIRAKRGE